MASGLAIKTIVEGVEKSRATGFFRLHRFDEMQVYYFSKPIPADWLRREIEKLLTDEQKDKAPKLDYDELMETLKTK